MPSDADLAGLTLLLSLFLGSLYCLRRRSTDLARALLMVSSLMLTLKTIAMVVQALSPTPAC